jgi:hypothetical protein
VIALKFRRSIAALFLLFGFSGCEPKERAVWSPDGRVAAVLIEHQLHFTDEKGRLTGSLETADGEPGRLLVEKMAWLADGSGLVIHRVRLASRWADLRPLLPTAEADRVEVLAATMPELLRSAVVLHGDADRADQLLAKLAPGESEAILNALRLAVVRDRGAVESALTDAPKARASLARESGEGSGFFLHELVLVQADGDGGIKEGGTIKRGLRGVASLQVSPYFPMVAVSRSGAEDQGHDLEVIALDGSSRETVARGMSAAFAWTPDGRGLVSLAPVAGGRGPLMRVLRSEVLDGGGRPHSSAAIKAEEIAIAVVPFAPRLTVLPGGDVLFASQPGNLPMRAGEAVRQPRLYLVPADGGVVREVPTGEGALPMDLGYFVPSPDGRRLAIVESGTDAVAVIDLASGASELVSAPHPGWKCRTLPSWKSSDELSYAALDPATGRARWVLWKPGGDEPVDLSADWPDGATPDWLEKTENNSIHSDTP